MLGTPDGLGGGGQNEGSEMLKLAYHIKKDQLAAGITFTDPPKVHHQHSELLASTRSGSLLRGE